MMGTWWNEEWFWIAQAACTCVVHSPGRQDRWSAYSCVKEGAWMIELEICYFFLEVKSSVLFSTVLLNTIQYSTILSKQKITRIPFLHHLMISLLIMLICHSKPKGMTVQEPCHFLCVQDYKEAALGKETIVILIQRSYSVFHNSILDPFYFFDPRNMMTIFRDTIRSKYKTHIYLFGILFLFLLIPLLT